MIQDPAGIAVGSSSLSGGGLSGAIYSKFKNLALIPNIKPKEAVLNTSEPRILHTHSPHLSKVTTSKEVVLEISEAYKNTISEFIDTFSRHQKNTLHFSAISAAIYGGKFSKGNDFKNHLDPSLTQLALVRAIHLYESEDPGKLVGKNFFSITLRTQIDHFLSGQKKLKKV